MKTLIWEERENGKTVGIHECIFVEPSSIETRKAKAKASKEEIDKAKAEEQAKKEAQEKEEREKAYQEAYYARWRIVFVCDSLLNDWQVGDDTIDQELVSACKRKALEGDSTGKLLGLYDIVRERFVETFGEATL